MGTPEFAVPPLECLIHNKQEVIAVYSQPDKLSGRGRTLSPPPVKKAALDWNLPVIQPGSLKDTDTIEHLVSLNPDVIVVAAFGQLLPQAVLNIPRLGCINLHPSLLPKYRGSSPVAGAILAGDQFAGISIMLMDAGLDTGPVLIRAQVPVSFRDTTGSLTTKLSYIAAHLLLEVLAGWSRGEIKPQPQKDSEASYTGQITKQEGEIDWSSPAEEIWRRVRAYQPWPGCYTRLNGKQLKIIEALPLSKSGDIETGKVLALQQSGANEPAFGINTGDGVLGVLKVQVEGKQIMAAEEFLRGQRQLVGEILPSG